MLSYGAAVLGIKVMILAMSTRAFIMVNFTGLRISLHTLIQGLTITPVLDCYVIAILMIMICAMRNSFQHSLDVYLWVDIGNEGLLKIIIIKKGLLFQRWCIVQRNDPRFNIITLVVNTFDQELLSLIQVVIPSAMTPLLHFPPFTKRQA